MPSPPPTLQRSVQLASCLSLLSAVLVFPCSVGLLWASGAANQDQAAALVRELEAAQPWRPGAADGRVYVEGLVLQASAGGDAPTSPLSGAPLIYSLVEHLVPHRKGGGASWRRHAEAGVACVGPLGQGARARLDLATASFPLGLPLLDSEPERRVRGLRPGATVCVFATPRPGPDGVALVGPWVFPQTSWAATLAEARVWSETTQALQADLGRLGKLLLGLGLTGLLASGGWRWSLRQREGP